MSLLKNYRLRIKSLLASDDIQKTLELEGVSAVGARAIASSRAVVSQSSLADRPERDSTRDNGVDNHKVDKH